MKLSEQERAADRMADAIADGLVEIGQRIGGCDRIAFMYADGSIERSSGGLCVDALHAECRRIARASISALTPEPAPVKYKTPCGCRLSSSPGCAGKCNLGTHFAESCELGGCQHWRSVSPPAPVEYRNLTPDEMRALAEDGAFIESNYHLSAGRVDSWDDHGAGLTVRVGGQNVSAEGLRTSWHWPKDGPDHAADDPVAARIGGAK